jgi:hypothetical protein
MKIIHSVSLSTLVAVLGLTLSTRAAIPPAENLVPSDTFVLLAVPDFAAVRADSKLSPQWLFWNDPAMKPFHDKFMGKWNESFVTPLERDLGVKLSDFFELMQGQLTVAVTVNGSNGHDDVPPGIVLLLDARNKSGLLKTNLATLQKKWVDSGKAIHSETIHGISFSVVPVSSNDIPATLKNLLPKRQPVQELGRETKPEKPSRLYIGQYESLLIVGNSPTVVEPVAAHLTGGAVPMLSDNAVFAADKSARFHSSPLYYAWFNAKLYFGILSQIPPAQPNPAAPSLLPQISWDKILMESGLMGLTSASFVYRESREGALVNFFLASPESTRSGILKIISPSAKDANAPVFVPSDVIKFWRCRLDGQKGWSELQKMLADLSPSAAITLNSLIDIANATAQQSDPGFDIRKNLIGNLGDDLINFQKMPAGTSIADLNDAPSLFLFAAANPDVAALALKTVASFSARQPAPEPRDFLGKKIYTIPQTPARTLTGLQAGPQALYLSASSGYVALTRNSSILESYLRSVQNPSKPLRETPGLAEAAQHVGGAGGGLFGYENQREVMRATFAAYKNSTDDSNPTSLSLIPKSLTDWMDFSLLPAYDKVSKYFYISVYAGSATSEGISINAFAPRPPQLN